MVIQKPQSNPICGFCCYIEMGAITVQNNVHLERLLTTDPTMEQYMRTAVAYVLQQARKDTMNEIAGALKTDPHHAARSVRRSLYKMILGGQINILRKRRASAGGSVGGSRRGRSADTERIMSYTGSDRGFILRFVNALAGGRASCGSYMTAAAEKFGYRCDVGTGRTKRSTVGSVIKLSEEERHPCAVKCANNVYCGVKVF